MDKVSVIIPTRNRPDMLRDAVLSVISQTRPAFEIIVVDDGSDDACQEKNRRIAGSHSSITLHRFPEKRGASAARNFGWNMARGDFILFLDDDDLLTPNALESQLSHFQNNPHWDVVCGCSQIFVSGRLPPASFKRWSTKIHLVSRIDGQRLEKEPFLEILRFHPQIHACLIKKKCLADSPFQTDFWAGEDILFWLKLAFRGCRFGFNPTMVARVRLHMDNLHFAPGFRNETIRLWNYLLSSGMLLTSAERFLCHARLLLLLAKEKKVSGLRHLCCTMKCPFLLFRTLLLYLSVQAEKIAEWKKLQARQQVVKLPDNTIPKPALLYLSPVMPAPSGNGLAMRAFHNLQVLAQAYDIHLLVIPTGLRAAAAEPLLKPLCRSIVTLSLSLFRDWATILHMLPRHFGIDWLLPNRSLPFEMRSFSRRRLRAAAAVFQEVRFDVIHIFRLYLYPYATFFRRKNLGATIQLDLDDIESETRKNCRNLLTRPRSRIQQRAEKDAARYEKMERSCLPHVDRVFITSELDKMKVETLFNLKTVEVLPNFVPPPTVQDNSHSTSPFVLLFVAAFGYFPNLDGLEFFTGQVMPLLRRSAPRTFRLVLVGAGIPWRKRLALQRFGDVVLKGAVPSLDQIYREAGAAIVPIRTGGGTRIKAIEAMLHGVPVISTSKGIEGLQVRPEADVLLGDNAYDMAHQCQRLRQHPELWRQLAANASAYAARSHNAERVRASLLKASKDLPCKKRPAIFFS